MIDFIVGIVGMGLLLVAFVLNEFNSKWHPETVKHNVVNAIGAGCLVYYAYAITSWPFFILNGVWFLASLRKLWLIQK